jgi:hypothetical protein
MRGYLRREGQQIKYNMTFFMEGGLGCGRGRQPTKYLYEKMRVSAPKNCLKLNKNLHPRGNQEYEVHTTVI